MPTADPKAVRARLRLLVLLCPLVAAAAGFASFAVQTPRFPYALDYGEGMILDEAWLLAQGHNIYRAANAPPYLVPSYPPIFMLAQAPLARWFGPAYWYGRLLSQLSAVALGSLLGLVVARLSGNRAAGLVTGLTLLAIPAFSITSQLDRVDTLAMALAAGSIACVVVPRAGPRLVAAGALLLLAGFTRQTAWIPAACAIGAHLVARRQSRRAVLFVASVAISAAVIVAIVQAATGGFWFAMVGSNAPFMSVAHAADVIRPALVPIPLLLAILVFAIAFGFRQRTAWAPLLAGYAAGAVPELVAALNVGSSTNYVFPVAAATAMGAGLAWSLLGEDRRGPAWTVILLLAAQVAWCAWLDRPFRLAAMPYLPTLQQTIARAPGPVLADEYLGLLPIAGKHVWIEPVKMADLARAGRWDERPFVEDVRSRKFSLVLLRTDARGVPDRHSWTDAMWSAIAGSYVPCGSIAVDAQRRVGLYRPIGACVQPGQ